MARVGLFLALFLTALFATRADAARLDVPFDFSTIETEHFLVHFHQGLKDAALKAASYAEAAHMALSKEEGASAGKTNIVLIDDSDFLSGSSTVLPYNSIYIQVAPPSYLSLESYDDWLKTVIVHEYSHIVFMDKKRGYSSFTRSVFGKPLPGPNPFSLLAFIATAPPNVFLPDWLLEGEATMVETKHSKGGRGHNSYTETVLRTATYEDNIPSIDRLNGTPYWPGGNVPYLFGFDLVDHIEKNFGEGSVDKLGYAHSGRFPYFLNGAPLLFIGKDYPSLYSEAVTELKARAGAEIEEIKRTPVTAPREIRFEGESLTHPKVSPDGRLLALNRADPGLHEAVLIAGFETPDIRDTVRVLPSDRVITWSPDSLKIYFSQSEVNSGFYVYEDLYSYDLASQKTRRLTYGLRVMEPDISPSGRTFAVIADGRGSRNLALLDATPNDTGRLDEKLEVVTDYKLMRVSSPRWSPDGSLIAYTVRDNNGRSSLMVYDIAAKAEKLLFKGGHIISAPSWSRDGAHIIYSSDETGVYNLHAYSIKDGKRYRITNMAGGAFEPEVGGGFIIFSSYTSRGFKIASINYSPEDWMEIVQETKEERVDEVQSEPMPTLKMEGPRPYSSLSTIAPRFWLPSLSRDRDGAVFGAYTAGADVLAYNLYRLEADYGAASGKFYFDAAYVNDALYPTFTVEARRRPVLYSDFLKRGDYYELNTTFGGKVAVPINSIESRWSFIAGYFWQRQEALSELSDGKFNGVEVFQGKRGYVLLGLEYSDSLKYPLSISREEGRDVSLIYRGYSRNTGSSVVSNEYILSYSEYIATLPRNVVYLNVKGGASAGNRTAQQAFQLGGSPNTSDFTLRGYRPRFETGKYITTATIEYRAPLEYIYGGWGTKPLFMEKLHGAVFVDGGEVWGGGTTNANSGKLRFGTGIEARLDIVAGYRLRITPVIGIARGINREGETQVYFTIYSAL